MKIIKLLVSAVVAVAAAGGAIWLIDHRQLFGAQTEYVMGGLMVVFLVALFVAATTLSSMRRAAAPESHGGFKRLTPPPASEAVAAKLDDIEAALKRMGAWQSEPLPPERYEFRQPFGMDTMAFEQWLQFVLIPRVRSIIETRGEFPPHSEVGAHAVREFDGRPEADTLCAILIEFDRLFGPVRFKGVDY